MNRTTVEPLELVTRTTALIELIAREGAAGASEIARGLTISKASAYRIAQSLVARDWLIQDESQNYRVGPAMRGLAVRTAGVESMTESLRPFMERLHEATQESIHFTRLEGRHVVYLQQLVSPRPVRSVIVLGGRSPAHAVSPGLAQLAYVSPARLDWYLALPPARFTASTISSPRELRAELVAVRERGFAVNIGGYRSDVGGVACAIVDGGEPVGALSICCPTYRLQKAIILEYGSMLHEVTAEATEAIRNSAA